MCTLTRSRQGWRLDGRILTEFSGVPARVAYRIGCEPAWTTRAVVIEMRAGDSLRAMQISVDPAARWYADGKEVPAVQGCVDVDLGVTPATNLLPIRRLAPAVGTSCELTAAWVRFPDLKVEPLPQRYTRLDDRTYRYESGGGAFSTVIVVDEDGFVTSYAGGWARAPP